VDFYKNKILNEVLEINFITWSYTQETGQYVSPKYLSKIEKMIFENLKKKVKEVEIYDLIHKQELGYKLGIFQKLKIYFSGLKPLYIAEKDIEVQCKESIEIDEIYAAKRVHEEQIKLDNIREVNQENLVEQKEEKENGED